MNLEIVIRKQGKLIQSRIVDVADCEVQQHIAQVEEKARMFGLTVEAMEYDGPYNGQHDDKEWLIDQMDIYG